MITRYIHENVKRNFSISIIWIKGGSNMDKIKRKGINQILCSLLTRGCEGFNNFELSDYIESYGGELNHEVLEDGISISIKSLDTHFKKLFPLINLMVNKPVLSEFHKKLKKKH